MSKEFIRPDQFARADKQRVAFADAEFTTSPEQKQELAALYDETFRTLAPGKLVTGTIIRMDSDGVLVDINYKSDGLIPRYEFGEHDMKKISVGSPIEVMLDELESVDGTVVLSYEKAKAMRAWDEISKLFEEGKPVEGIVTHKVKGGLSVDIGVPAFLPGSQIDLQRVLDFDQYVGQSITAYILKINRKRGNVIISRRKYLSDQRSESRKKRLDTLNMGQVVQGSVKNILDYGAFIDLGGIDGLLHITDMTWGRIQHPSELLRIGQPVTVVVLSFDKDNEKISLGLKQLSDNPWQKVAEQFKTGDRIRGKISSITDYGLFVEVAKGVEGLVHISEVSWTDRISDLHHKFKVGQDIEVLIVSLDADKRRMSLSIKQLDKNPWESVEEMFKVGQKVKGTISNITDFGIFVQLLPGIDGLLHISDLSWTDHINHPGDLYKKGQELEALILGMDKEKKQISLGVKQLEMDPWDSIEQNYTVGSIVEGEVSKITNFGAFVKLGSGIEGLIHISELSDDKNDKVEDVLKVGQKVQCRVLNINKGERKVGLSLKLEQPKVEPRPQVQQHEKKAQQPKQKEAKSHHKDNTSANPASKTKSMLQIELERHAARQKEDAETSEE
ncbi:30S ribosomal protein S1 [Vermiphilus pyriformis]|nr:MAG: 30S ribosomal protein S1 [Vermiphilus pyriformis]